MVTNRQLRVVVYHSPLFRAHWGVIVPNSASEESLYTKIHVTGSLAEGFVHEFQRTYDLDTTGRTNSTFDLGTVDKDAVATFPSVVIRPEDMITPTNRLEQIALTVPAPGPSLRSATSVGGKVGLSFRAIDVALTRWYEMQTKPIEIKDCQYWLKQYVAALVNEGLLGPTPGAR